MYRSSLYLLAVLSLWAACQPASQPEGQASATPPYQEAHRPQFHFSPDSMWMNDPNGMFFLGGEYHLFYQFYPDSNIWGPMHWGHAISRDLVHWEHLPIALYPDSLGYIFSGSAVVDHTNTSGFGADGQVPIIAMFTHHDPEGERAGRDDFQYQSIAYSLDRGRTWTKYAGNPVIPNAGVRDFRDPKVLWDAERGQWLMVLAAKDRSQFWASPDLKTWRFLSDFGAEWGAHGGVWECPDFFPLPIEGETGQKWVLLQSLNPGHPHGGSGTQYFIGDFDGQRFTLDPDVAAALKAGQTFWLDWGRDNYAGVTWSGIPASDGRRLFMGWMSNWAYATLVPTYRWRSAMTLPRELRLLRGPQGLRLGSQPAAEVAALRAKTLPTKAQAGIIADGEAPLLLEIKLAATWAEGQQPKLTLRFSNAEGEHYDLGYDAATNLYFSDRQQAGPNAFSPAFASAPHTAPGMGGQQVELQLFLDLASCEAFAEEGLVNISDIVFPSSPFTRAELLIENGAANIERLEAHALKRIWAQEDK